MDSGDLGGMLPVDLSVCGGCAHVMAHGQAPPGMPAREAARLRGALWTAWTSTPFTLPGDGSTWQSASPCGGCGTSRPGTRQAARAWLEPRYAVGAYAEQVLDAVSAGIRDGRAQADTAFLRYLADADGYLAVIPLPPHECSCGGNAHTAGCGYHAAARARQDMTALVRAEVDRRLLARTPGGPDADAWTLQRLASAARAPAVTGELADAVLAAARSGAWRTGFTGGHGAWGECEFDYFLIAAGVSREDLARVAVYTREAAELLPLMDRDGAGRRGTIEHASAHWGQDGGETLLDLACRLGWAEPPRAALLHPLPRPYATDVYTREETEAHARDKTDRPWKHGLTPEEAEAEYEADTLDDYNEDLFERNMEAAAAEHADRERRWAAGDQPRDEAERLQFARFQQDLTDAAHAGDTPGAAWPPPAAELEQWAREHVYALWACGEDEWEPLAPDLYRASQATGLSEQAVASLVLRHREILAAADPGRASPGTPQAQGFPIPVTPQALGARLARRNNRARAFGDVEDRDAQYPSF